MDYRELDPKVTEIVKGLPRLEQVQYSTDDQLKHLHDIAGKLGLYDAKAFLNRVLTKNGR
jgi:hypothetical protein